MAVSYPAIPAPDTTLEGLHASVAALKNAVEMLTAQSGKSTGLKSATQNDLSTLQAQVNFVQTSIPVVPAALDPTPITASLGADVALNNVANYFDGPSVAQGSTGTWFVTASVTAEDTAGAAYINYKLWDGTTVIDSGRTRYDTSGAPRVVTLSGFIAAPAGNLKVSCQDITSTSGVIRFNASGNSKDSTITAFRIK